jgi:hypothetical protein
MSLWISIRPSGGNSNAASGHHRAPSSVFGSVPLIDSGMSIVAPLTTETFPHHTHPFVGSSIGPAPLVLSNGYVCWPERISWA